MGKRWEAIRRTVGLLGRRKGMERPFDPDGKIRIIRTEKYAPSNSEAKHMFEITSPGERIVGIDTRRRLRDRLLLRKKRPLPK